MSPTLTAPDLVAYLEGWNAARETREEQRRSPYSYLSYAGFHKLGASPASFDGIPGRWTTGPDGPAVELAYGEELVVDGQLITGSHRFSPVRERELRKAAQFGDVIIELSKRGGQDLLRPLDPAYGRRLLDGYDHTPAFEPDPRWVFEGQFLPFESIRPTPLDATIGGLVHIHPAIGEVVFTLEGIEQRLLIIVPDGQPAGEAGTGIVLFADATNAVTTDPLGRSLYVDYPAQAGPVTLDFNFARNLQRPYTKFAPCPLSPPQNTLPVAIEAGDQLPVFTA
jgi:uncharacterized protein (DUF1684 family)